MSRKQLGDFILGFFVIKYPFGVFYAFRFFHTHVYHQLDLCSINPMIPWYVYYVIILRIILLIAIDQKEKIEFILLNIHWERHQVLRTLSVNGRLVHRTQSPSTKV